MSLNYANVPSDVVALVIADTVDGETKDMPWRILSALPEGGGISSCLPQYVKENIEELNGRYLLTVSNGQIDLLCREKELDVLVRNECFVLYQMY